MLCYTVEIHSDMEGDRTMIGILGLSTMLDSPDKELHHRERQPHRCVGQKLLNPVIFEVWNVIELAY